MITTGSKSQNAIYYTLIDMWNDGRVIDVNTKTGHVVYPYTATLYAKSGAFGASKNHMSVIDSQEWVKYVNSEQRIFGDYTLILSPCECTVCTGQGSGLDNELN